LRNLLHSHNVSHKVVGNLMREYEDKDQK